MDKKILRGAVKAFTLLELIVVIAIIVIMSSILIPNVSNQRRMAKIQAQNDQAYQIYVAAQDYLNNLQKRGLKSEDYFGEIEFDSKKYGVMKTIEYFGDMEYSTDF
ncbi:MAG: prepilin-type N-terminal cleavage/methylation domain-containing protein [Oscillospiraceae bacterium]|nr:prepilin-type N-terminal cleavage/methylation domain-containing protein [Oscillospiraceae bacterium]